jgi:type II secretory pathway component PulF
MEIAVLQASERSGKIDTGLAHLAEFFRAIAEARSRFWAKSAYPLFIFHFGAVALSFPALIGEQGSLSAFLSSALGMLAALYLGLIGAALLVRFLGAAAIRSATLDRVLNMVPLLGPARRAFALTRFCGAYQMQLDAGINVPTALESAARASQSGLLAKGVAIALPAIRAGGSMAENLAATRTLPHDISDSLLVGEESGRLDEELTRLTAELRTLAFRRLDIVAEWLPKLLYLGILIFMAWRILAFYNGYLQEIRDVQGL